MATRGTRGAVAAGTDFAADAGMRMFLAGGAAGAEDSHFAFGGEAPIVIRARAARAW